MKKLLYEDCHINKWWIDEMAIQDGRLHMAVPLASQYSVAELVQIFKRRNRVLRKESPDFEVFFRETVFGRMGILPKRSVRSINRFLNDTSVIRERTHSQIMSRGRNPGF